MAERIEKNKTPGRIIKIAGRNDAGRRADRVVRKLSEKSASLSSIYSGFRTGAIQINGRKTAPSKRIQEGDAISFSRDLADILLSGRAQHSIPPSSRRGAAIEIPRLILHENEHICALGKPAGILTHGRESLHEAFSAYIGNEIPGSLSFSPSPLHRLDRNTSGIVVFGKSLPGTRRFTELLREGGIVKLYAAVLEGMIEEEAVWEDRLSRDDDSRVTVSREEGKRSVLRICPLLTSNTYTLCAVIPATGRTHQIRAQCALRGYPLRGDVKYGGAPVKGNRYFLHAYRVTFPEGEELFGTRRIVSPLPEEFVRMTARSFPGFSADIFKSGIGRL